MMSTTKRGTIDVLNGRFLDPHTLYIDEDYLNRELQDHLMSDEALYNRIKGTRTIENIVKDGIVLIADILLDTKHQDDKHHATRKQIEDWLEDSGRGSLSIAKTIEYVKNERELLRSAEKDQ